MAQVEDIAIVGYSFKLPQNINDNDSFWEVLQTGRNLRTEWPESRMNVDAFRRTRDNKELRGLGGHFMNEHVGAFDAPFFSVTAKEAAAMDPTQRMSLEVSYHAIENAGIPIESLKGSRTAVFSASMLEDYPRITAIDPENAERTAVTGSTVASVIPNRISWYFDLRGPSIHVNTACSSSLAAVDMACKTLKSGDASCAIVTGANLILDPAIFQVLSSQNFLSPDSVCYSFDHRANGYGRGEGIVALVLKPVSAALQNGDMIRAVIRSTGSNQDGHTPVMTQPSPQAQEDLIHHVYKQANLSFDETRYVEAHGTGTPVGDPIEMKAIGLVFRKYRSAVEPLYVGSVKSSVGHLEGASALASIILSTFLPILTSVTVMLEKGIIPTNALFEKLNPSIDADFYHTVVPTQNITWPSAALRRISVNSFGFGGSNSHIVLDDALHYLKDRSLVGNHCTISPPSVSMANSSATAIDGTANGNGTVHLENGMNRSSTAHGTSHLLNGSVKANTPLNLLPKLLVWTSADENAVKRTIQTHMAFYEEKVSGNPAMVDRLAFTLASRRSHMLWRTFAVIMNSPEVDQKISPAKPVRSSAESGLGFVFTGQGAQYVSMGWDLIQYPIFAETLSKIEDIYRSIGCQWSIFGEKGKPLSTAVQIALLELLRTFGITPKAIVGHSSGEIAAAYAIGALSLVSACKVSFYRGLLAGKLRVESADSPGAMISVNLPETSASEYLKSIKNADTCSVGVACINSPLNCTLSGPEQAIDAIKIQADTDGIFAQKIKTGVAYHSSSMNAIADEYLSLMGSLEDVESGSPKAKNRIPMVSSLTGKVVTPSTLATAEYWVENLVSPVRFADAVQILTQETSTLKVGMGTITDLVEIGPHPVLKRFVQDTIRQPQNRKKQIRYLGVLHRLQPPIKSMLELVGNLFCLGHTVRIQVVNQQSTKDLSPFLVDCPEYPFDRSQISLAESRISRDFRLRGTTKGETLGVRVSDWNPLEPRWRNFLSIESTPWIRDHVVSNTVLYPAAGMLVMAIEAVQQMMPPDSLVTGYLVRKAEFTNPILVLETWEDRTETQVRLRPVKQQQSNELASFDVVIFSYLHGVWTECFHANVDIDYESPLATRHEDLQRRYRQAAELCEIPIDSTFFYRSAADNGLQYGDWFQLLRDIHWDGKANALGRVDVTKARFQTSSLVHPAVLDQAFHVLRASAGQQNATNVPVRVSDAWFASSGWQGGPGITTITWLATSVSPISENYHGEKGSLYALADDGTVLCTIGQAATATISGDTQETKKEKDLLYSIDWKPQLSLLKPEQLKQYTIANSVARDESTIVTNHAKLCATLNRVAVRTLRQIDRSKLQGALHHYVAWMERYVSKLPPAQQAESICNTELEAQLCDIETTVPAWKLYTTCARKLPEMLAGEVDPLQVVFGSNLADIFYAYMFQTLCTDGRFTTILDLASHENPNLRVLEVGAGTGGMTGHVLEAFQRREKGTGASSFAEYTYTDISPVFFERGSSRWEKWYKEGRMSFKTLDLNTAIETQGFEPGSYDLVVAASVLHATPDLQVTLRNVRRALKPGGQLVLVEITNPDDVAVTMMAGLLPGWWIGREEWRKNSAVVPDHLWDECLRASGFSGNDVVIRDYQSEMCHFMSIIISTAMDETAGTISKPKQSLGRLILVVDQQSNEQHEQQIRLADLVRDCIDPESRLSTTTCVFSLNELSNALANLYQDDIVIVLAEVNNRPLLSRLSAKTFAYLQHLIKHAPKLLWATATSINDAQYADYSAVQGFLRSIRAEQSDKHIVSIAIEDEKDTATCAQFIANAFRAAFGSSSSSKEVEYIVRDGLIMTGRVVKNENGNHALKSLLYESLQYKPWAEGNGLRLSEGTHGALESLRFVQDPIYDNDIDPHEVEIEAQTWGLSDRDVQTALGRVNVEYQSLGSGFVGLVSKIGRDCKLSIQPGDRVCVIAPGAIRKYPRVHESAIFEIPDTLSNEAVASIIIPGMTAYHSLVDVARLRKGDKVLIHLAASGIGQVAVWIAKMQDAVIFATVSSSEQKEFLIENLAIDESSIFDSHGTFPQDVLNATQRYGVDVILNTLSGENALQASCECLAPGGRFIEVGHVNVNANTKLPMELFARNLTFSVVDLAQLSPEIISGLLQNTIQLFSEETILPPQPLHIFNSSEIQQAFGQVQNGQTIGCTAITLRPEDLVPHFIRERRSWKFDKDVSYLIAGGSGGLGRAIMQWMADRGAKHLITLSRSGATSKAGAQKIAELTASGVKVFSAKCDVSSEKDLASTLAELSRTMPPIKGCINAAVVLQDAIFQESMTFEKWELAMLAKVQTSWNLHSLLPENLDFFILLSSLAGVIGQMASSNYTAGCTFQDALTRYRVSRGQKSVSINIGWMRNIGLIAETGEYQRQRQKLDDMQPINDSELLALLTLCCDPTNPLPVAAQGQGQVVFGLRTPAEILSEGRAVPAHLERPLFAGFSRDAQSTASAKEVAQLDREVAMAATLFRKATTSEERIHVVLRALAAKLARAMSISPDDVEHNKPLSSYGVDSLMAVELRNWIGREFEATVSVFDIMGGISIGGIADLVASRSTVGQNFD
ncbi:hypothetical protein BGW36DRAFT_330426 [Talaromyces proteolyticus]|uniref:Polyketide synthase n=1 Tax=Talaromyces proteolyticus TaxID=1131652 RepID=A0AAD4KFA6_9EURO|nr:uncharacterized protein BGW36DRAFT_330426 [Talaromyces proteolyticus]KAH8689590.1 hypothetical protein BGW36DRAFT_330426 [Talaromyces proteolyticus]